MVKEMCGAYLTNGSQTCFGCEFDQFLNVRARQEGREEIVYWFFSFFQPLLGLLSLSGFFMEHMCIVERLMSMTELRNNS